MDSFRYVGSTPTDLEGGRPIEPGEFTGEIDVSEDAPKNKMLLDDGLLMKVAPDSERIPAEEKAAKAAQKPAAEKPAATASDTGKAGEGS